MYLSSGDLRYIRASGGKLRPAGRQQDKHTYINTVEHISRLY